MVKLEEHSREMIFAVECSRCKKWRTIPNVEDYEDIRSRLSEDPFCCEKKENKTCNDPADLDESVTASIFFMDDVPDIPKAPTGFERLIRARSNYSKVDVTYISPTGKRLRSSNELRAYLKDNDDYKELNIDMFSFKAPKFINKGEKGKASSSFKNAETSEAETSSSLDGAAIKMADDVVSEQKPKTKKIIEAYGAGSEKKPKNRKTTADYIEAETAKTEIGDAAAIKKDETATTDDVVPAKKVKVKKTKVVDAVVSEKKPKSRKTTVDHIEAETAKTDKGDDVAIKKDKTRTDDVASNKKTKIKKTKAVDAATSEKKPKRKKTKAVDAAISE